MSRVWACPVLVVVVLASSACGGSDSSDSVRSPVPTSSPVAVPLATVPVATAPLTSAPPVGESPPTSIVAQSVSLGSVVIDDSEEVVRDPATGELIHRDGSGTYICTLLRTDDLAALRARAVQSIATEEEAP